jgi:hypothetical protein
MRSILAASNPPHGSALWEPTGGPSSGGGGVKKKNPDQEKNFPDQEKFFRIKKKNSV